ncbi:MAG: lysylphosphatidylglycerol synthase domain-containing protein [Acetobacteraceae bacterium]
MRKIAVLIAIGGVALGTGLVVWLGAGKIWRALIAVGWGGFAVMIAWQFLIFLVLVTAWYVIYPGGRWLVLVWGRLVRDGATKILPFSGVGGLVFGARAIAIEGVSSTASIVSSLADLAAESLGEILFLLLGIVLLLAHRPKGAMFVPAVIGAALVVLGGGVLIWTERHSARLFQMISERVAQRWVMRGKKQSVEVEREFNRIFTSARRIGCAAGLHLVGWTSGGVALWICYRFLGATVGLLPCMAIEALLSAALSVALLVPIGPGVQEV